MSDTLKRIASEYYANVRALQDHRCTAEQHRAENRRLKDLCSPMEWEQAKLAACASLDRSGR